jgi:hypothetical protein
MISPHRLFPSFTHKCHHYRCSQYVNTPVLLLMSDVEASEPHPLQDVLRNVTTELANTAHLYTAATQQLLAERSYQIAALDGCLKGLNPFPMGCGRRIKRLEDTFLSLKEPQVHIDGCVVEFVESGKKLRNSFRPPVIHAATSFWT